MRAMRGGHVLAHSEETLSTIATHMAGDPPATMDDLDRVGGGADFDRLARQFVRHGVIVVVELDVIIDVHARRFPGGELVARSWQRLQRSTFEFLEEVVTGDGLATKPSGVDQPELLSNGRVQLGQ